MKTGRILWSETTEGIAAYAIAKKQAQAFADSDGCDRGLEANEVFRCWVIRTLPQKQHRSGFELRIECVSATDLSRCQPGHGPVAGGRS